MKSWGNDASSAAGSPDGGEAATGGGTALVAAAEARQRLGPARAVAAQRRRERAPERPRDPSSAGDIFGTTTSSRRRRLGLRSCPSFRRRRRPCLQARCKRCARRARARGLSWRSIRRTRHPVPRTSLGAEFARRPRRAAQPARAPRGGVSVAWLFAEGCQGLGLKIVLTRTAQQLLLTQH